MKALHPLKGMDVFVAFFVGEGGRSVGAVEGAEIRYAYEGAQDYALKDVALSLAAGEFAVFLGRNGSGKSTLVQLCNALLPLRRGALTVAGFDVKNADTLWQLRRKCGMVFQNPDNQFVSSLVEEDVAFGLINYGTPPQELKPRVREALRLVGLDGFEGRAPHTLSGGQKQRAALAGVLALEPEVLILDEVTAMLDPDGRREVLDTVHRLHTQHGQTVMMITHYVEEAVRADSVYLLADGALLAHGAPRDILTDEALLQKAGLCAPTPVRLYYDLARRGISLPSCPLTESELVEALCKLS